MPFIFENANFKIKRENDKRIKLSLEDKEYIVKLYKTGNYSHRKLASMYGVSRRLIQFCLGSPRQKVDNKLYYDKEKHKEYMKKYREHKGELYKQGLLEKEGN